MPDWVDLELSTFVSRPAPAETMPAENHVGAGEASCFSPCGTSSSSLEERINRSSPVREWHKEDRESAIRYLVGDPGADALNEGKIDYTRMPLRQYFAAVRTRIDGTIREIIERLTFCHPKRSPRGRGGVCVSADGRLTLVW